MRDHIDYYKGEDLEDDDARSAMFDSAEAIHDHCSANTRALREHIDGRAPSEDDGEDGKGGDNDGAGAARAAPKDAKAEVAALEERRKKASRLHAEELIRRINE